MKAQSNIYEAKNVMFCDYCGDVIAKGEYYIHDDGNYCSSECLANSEGAYDATSQCPCGCNNVPKACVYASTCCTCGKKFFGYGYCAKDYPCDNCRKAKEKEGEG